MDYKAEYERWLKLATDEEINAAVAMIYELEGKHWREILSGRSLGPGTPAGLESGEESDGEINL